MVDPVLLIDPSGFNLPPLSNNLDQEKE